MATLALSLAGQFAGGLIGGPIGATIGRALGALAGSALDTALFGDKPEPAALPELRLTGSSEGGAIPRLYGWSRLGGNIIWATELEEIAPEDTGAKGLFGDGDDEPAIAANFAIGLCEGEVHRLGRIWADGQILETEGLTIRFHRGTEDQGVDSLIEAIQGEDAAPAYRGLCYLVFERLPLTQFGNRIPNISVELCRVVGELEPMVRAVTVIPGATEFGYDPTPRVRIVSPGVTASENAHLQQRTSDWTLSIDELCDLCPNLTNVALVVAWFGDDLRAGSCTIRPKVENTTRVIEGAEWQVAGVTRGAAGVISEHDGGPAYGGTPSDAAVLAAIADLKARGLAVTLYPILLMDIPVGNPMGQPAYPWRGRITSSADGTAAVAADVDGFVGTTGEWGLRRMLLHYAQLCDDAGGVDAFLLGSEFRGMSFLRDDADGFPFVDQLKALAAEVAAIIPAAKLTYGADWSEFPGLQVGGDKFFHLDPLWADANIDAAGIDNYMPLSDWRDGMAHADAALTDSPYDLPYLTANIAGGEGYDWYYATDADRVAGMRSPITDGAYGEPWVWRFKDLASWWGNAHHNRAGGVRSGTPTNWIPGSKPIWFTELGCGATDKGANQPNIFGDPKSSESGSPYFSTGAPDPLIQRQFLRAHLTHWAGSAMVDPGRIYLWTWDARPFPAFPASDAWADGPNHATGHWLTGRLGGLATDELVAAIGADYGVEIAAADARPPLIQGEAVEAVVACRDALAPVLDATGLTVRESEGGLAALAGKRAATVGVDRDDRVAANRPLTSRRRPDPTEAISQVAMSYPDRGRDYLAGTVTAARPGGGAVTTATTNLTLDLAGARSAAERMLTERSASRDTLELVLPPSFAALEAGDVVDLDGEGEGPFEISEVRDTDARRITARAVSPVINPSILSGRSAPALVGPPAKAMPLVMIAHLPGVVQSRLVAAAWANPWPGEIVLRDEASSTIAGRIVRPGHIGMLSASLAAGPVHYWDEINTITLTLHSGHLASTDDKGALAGANRIAVKTDSGAWEVIAFAEADLVAPATYELGRLLRGQQGTGHAVGTAAAGNPIIVLDDRVVEMPVAISWIGETLNLLAGETPMSVAVEAGPALPIAPAHPRAIRAGGTSDIIFTWTRRSRADGDGWGIADAPLEIAPEAYRVTIYDGATPVRTIETTTPAAPYSAVQQTTDFGSPPANFAFTIAQLSPVLGPGHAATGAFDA